MPPHGTNGSAADDRDRGQLILVTALSLAILFVTLALILNTAIYTENLATRASDIGGGTDAVRYHDAARDSVGGVVDYVNANNHTDHATLQSNLSAGVDAFSNHSGRLFAVGDRAVETRLAVTVDGTRITQTDASRNFTNTSFEADWTVVEDVEHTRAFVINVTKVDGSATPGSPDVFRIVVTGNGGSTWSMNITADPNRVVGIDAGGDEFTCSGSATPVINVTAGTVDGTTCNGLEFADGLNSPYRVAFENGPSVNGTYSFVVDNDTLAGSPGPHLVADGSGQPFAAHAVYSANVTVVYQTPRLHYNATVRVAPGENDG